MKDTIPSLELLHIEREKGELMTYEKKMSDISRKEVWLLSTDFIKSEEEAKSILLLIKPEEAELREITPKFKKELEKMISRLIEYKEMETFKLIFYTVIDERLYHPYPFVKEREKDTELSGFLLRTICLPNLSVTLETRKSINWCDQLINTLRKLKSTKIYNIFSLTEMINKLDKIEEEAFPLSLKKGIIAIREHLKEAVIKTLAEQKNEAEQHVERALALALPVREILRLKEEFDEEIIGLEDLEEVDRINGHPVYSFRRK